MGVMYELWMTENILIAILYALNEIVIAADNKWGINEPNEL